MCSFPKVGKHGYDQEPVWDLQARSGPDLFNLYSIPICNLTFHPIWVPRKFVFPIFFGMFMLINILNHTIKTVIHQVSKLKEHVTTSHTSLIVEVCRRMCGEIGDRGRTCSKGRGDAWIGGCGPRHPSSRQGRQGRAFWLG